MKWKAWLEERGFLHDARVTSFDLVTDGALEVALDDEWANERGSDRPAGIKSPITLSFVNVTIHKGSPENVSGGWLSELVAEDDRILRFVFCDRPELVIRGDLVTSE